MRSTSISNSTDRTNEINFNKTNNPQEISLLLENQRKNQDGMIQEFSGLVKKIHKANKEIEDEIKSQNPLISNLDTKVDKMNIKVVNTSTKLDNYLEKSSNWCLCGVISIEVLIVILILISY